MFIDHPLTRIPCNADEWCINLTLIYQNYPLGLMHHGDAWYHLSISVEKFSSIAVEFPTFAAQPAAE